MAVARRITRDLILKELSKLALCYPSARVDSGQIDVFADMWAVDLANMTEQLFMEALSLHRKNSNFFPTVKDIRDKYAEIVSRPREFKAITHEIQPMTPEEMKHITEKKYRRVVPMPVLKDIPKTRTPGQARRVDASRVRILHEQAKRLQEEKA